MSHSYKKNPIYTDGRTPTPKKMKHVANKKVKHNETSLKGKGYKKIFCSYDIHDYKSRWTWEEAKFSYFHQDPNGINWQEDYPTLKSFYRYWRKYYFNK